MSNVVITLTILLVEDEDYKIEKINSFLLHFPFIRIVLAKDQVTALQHLEKEKFDVLILDMQLPLRTGEDPDRNGGERILLDLETHECFKQPNTIVVLTQYTDLQNHLKNSFEEIAAVKFNGESDEWKTTLSRIITRSIKAKGEFRRIIYCEGNNAPHYNQMGLINTEFRGLQDCRAVYLAAKNEKEKFALRDRDFLTDSEIKKLRIRYPNYFVLGYYCFENYLFHPDNIIEIKADFDINSYKEEIAKQKNLKLMTIIQDYKISRSAYLELNDENKFFLDKFPEDDIIKCLQSDNFESFYKYFDMAGKKDSKNQKSFDRTYLNGLNLSVDQLCNTNWFKTQICQVLEKSL